MSATYPELPDHLTEQQIRILELIYQEQGIDLRLFASRLQSTFATILSGAYYIRDILEDIPSDDEDIETLRMISDIIIDVGDEWHDIAQEISAFDNRRTSGE